ncbi:MAG: cell division protein FtsQ/DivIB, partial [Pseudomonadota bacterium]
NEGVIIHEKDLKPYFNLPIFIGDGSEIYANSLITIFREEPELFKHIHAIIRVSERRWNIRLDNDLEIKMPEENFEEAWKKVIKLYKKKELLNPEISVIDLRVANKIFVEKR